MHVDPDLCATQPRYAAAYRSHRHTYGTLLHSGGTDLKVISEMMRHSKVGTTVDIYVHADTALQHEAVERLAAALRDAPCTESRATERAKSAKDPR
jgi:integrase